MQTLIPTGGPHDNMLRMQKEAGGGIGKEMVGEARGAGTETIERRSRCSAP